MIKKCLGVLAVTGLLITGNSPFVTAAGEDMQKQIDGIMGALPKFAVPMREAADVPK